MDDLREAFERRFGRAPRFIASAPGRINLIGEHTDYNDGLVLPMAVEFRTTIAAEWNHSDRIVLHTEAADETAVLDLSEPLLPEAKGRWLNYPKGVLSGFLGVGHPPKGFDGLIRSNVPMGAGLSSSAALEVATATLLEGVCGVQLSPIEKALLCQRAEHTFAGVPCGLMDPFIVTLGRRDEVLLLDCASREATWVPFDDPSVTVLTINTNVKHQLAASEYALRRQQCAQAAKALDVRSLREATLGSLEAAQGLDRLLHKRARHVITEIDRTRRAAQCLRDRAWRELGMLLNASHESLRYDYEVSCPELDTAVGIAQGYGPEGGVYGCRMTGGGFGGCVVALVAAEAVGSIMGAIDAQYRRRTGIAPTLFVTRPAEGATLLQA